MAFDWFKRNKSLPAGETSSAETISPVAVKPATAEPVAPAEALSDTPGKGFFFRLRQGLTRSREQLVEGVGRLVLGKKVIDAELLEDLEALLLQADLGAAATREIMDSVTERVRRKELTDPNALQAALRESLLDILRPRAQPWSPEKGRSQVLLMVGINGAGKTTTIGKLAAHWKAEGFGIVLAAGDTFRAAAVEQLQGWGKR
ncbi:MAG: signal recognition particle receptor subunit alpha, partial [Acidithiobacillus sp.]